MQRSHLIAIAALALSLALVSGCGGDSPPPSLARFAAPGSVVFVESALRPSGNDLADLVREEIEDSVAGGAVDFDREVEPWLGRKGAVTFDRVADGGLSEPLIAAEIVDPAAARAFVDRRRRDGGAGRVLGVVDETLLVAPGRRALRTAVDASEGDSLADEDRFQETIATASGGGFAEAYVDIGGILEQSGDRVDPRVRGALRGAGFDPADATVVAVVNPRPDDRIEIDVSGDLGGRRVPQGDVSALLGSLPAQSLAAFAFAGFGEQLEEALDELDESGIPGALGPGELKTAFAQTGVDLDGVARSLESGAVFVTGGNRGTLGGALVLSGRSSEAADAVAGLGRLLRGARVPGITAVIGRASGFSIRSRELGDKPLVVLGRGSRVSVGYGLRPALAGIRGESRAALADAADFKAASAALGKTPISGYVDGPAALRLAEALVPRSSGDFWKAAPYLRKVNFIGIGIDSEDDVATARLIAGLR